MSHHDQQQHQQQQQQFCLRWSNHGSNLSGWLSRLRESGHFADVTLVTAEDEGEDGHPGGVRQRGLQCHKILLSAGSEFLSEILSSNPCEHPTVVLSRVRFADLERLVDFIYSGEVAVEQSNLPRLLEAARILRIKGLHEAGNKAGNETGSGECEKMPNGVDHHEEEEEVEVPPSVVPEERPEVKSVQKRKKRRLEHGRPTKFVKMDHQSPSVASISPLDGISNAHFIPHKREMTESISGGDQRPTMMMLSSEVSINPSPIWQTEAQRQTTAVEALLRLPGILNDLHENQQQQLVKSEDPTAGIEEGSHPNGGDVLTSTPVRRYKQYSDQKLKTALQEICDGQSINKTSQTYSIPARTLRDWMKRYNIKSAFTHNSSGRSSSVGSSNSDSSVNSSNNNNVLSPDGIINNNQLTANSPFGGFPGNVAFPVMPSTSTVVTPLPLSLPLQPVEQEQQKQMQVLDREEEEEEEIDDDEEGETVALKAVAQLAA